jgi:hypothetical protein
MKQYRVYFKKNGINLTKIVYADSLSEVLFMFKDSIVVKVLCLDKEEDDEEDD